MLVHAAPPPTVPATNPRRIGTQEYPVNEALDQWAQSSQYQSVPQFFREMAQKFPDKPFLGHLKGRKVVYDTRMETQQKTDHFTSGLIELGIQPGDVVTNFMGNRAEWWLADQGVLSAGCIHAPLYDEMSDDKLHYAIKSCKAKVLVVDTESRLSQVLKAEAERGELSDLQQIVVVDPKVDFSKFQTNKQLHRWNDVVARGEAALPSNQAEMTQRLNDIKATDPGGMVATSGSTGNPKWCVLSHGNWLATLEGVLREWTGDPEANLGTVIERKEIYGTGAPMGHVMGRLAAYIAGVVSEGQVVMTNGQKEFLTGIRRFAPTFLVLSPKHYQSFFDGAAREAHKDSSRIIPGWGVTTGAAVTGGALTALAGAFMGAPLVGLAVGAGLGAATALATNKGWTRGSMVRRLATAALGGAGFAAAGAAVGGLPGAIAGGILGVGLTAGTRAVADKLCVTRSEAFDWAVGTAEEFFGEQAQGEVSFGTGVKYAVAKNAVFPEIRAKIDRKTGGNLTYMLSGGAELPRQLEAFFRACGYKMAQGYGQSETTAAVTLGQLRAPVGLAVNPVEAGRTGRALGAAVGTAVGTAVGLGVGLLCGSPLGGAVAGAGLFGGMSAWGAGRAASWAAERFTQAPWHSDSGTLGKALPGMEYKIAKDGELLLRGPSIMSGGYLDQPKKTKETIDKEGWLHTGDLAAVDENGNLLYRGRKQSQFKLPGSVWVTPEPIEEALRGIRFQLPGEGGDAPRRLVDEAVVVGDTVKDRCGALIIPNFDNLAAWAAAQGLPTDPPEMAANEEIIEFVAARALEASGNFAAHERIREVCVLDKPFSGEEITRKGNFVRPVVHDHYAGQIAAMFGR